MSRSTHHGCGKSCGLCRPHKRFRGRAWAPRSKREQAALSEPLEQQDDDFEGIAAELRLMAHEITRDLARNGHHLRVCE